MRRYEPIGQARLFTPEQMTDLSRATFRGGVRYLDPRFSTKPYRLFIDMNAFYASVEQQDNPALRGKPVAVVPVMADTTKVITASYEARAYKVKTGVFVGDARRMCPEIIFIEARRDRYYEIQEKLQYCVQQHFNTVDPLSIDEMACTLERAWQNSDGAKEIALAIKRDIRKALGEFVRCSIGVGPNVFWAKVAADLQKPDGLTILNEDFPERLGALPLQDLPGIGGATEQLLNLHNIRSVADLLQTNPDSLREVWGEIVGNHWYQKLRGSLVEDYQSGSPGYKRSISSSKVLGRENRDYERARVILRQMIGDMLAQLREYGRTALQLDVGVVRFVGNRKVGNYDTRIHATGSNSDQGWSPEIEQLIERLIPKESNVFVVHASFSNLSSRIDSPGLFDTIAASKLDAVAAAMDRINARFGVDTIVPLSALGPRQRMTVIPFGPPRRSVRG